MTADDTRSSATSPPPTPGEDDMAIVMPRWTDTASGCHFARSHGGALTGCVGHRLPATRQAGCERL